MKLYISLLSILLFGLTPLISRAQSLSIDQLEDSFKEAKRSDNIEKRILIELKIGDYYSKQKRYRKAIRKYKNTLKESQKGHFVKQEIIAYNKIGLAYSKQNKYEDALENLKIAIRKAKENRLQELIVLSQKNWNATQVAQKKRNKAKDQYDKYSSMSKEEALRIITKENKNDSKENQRFLEEISNLNKENQLAQLKLRFKQDEIEKTKLKINLLNKYNALKTAKIKAKNTEIEKRKAIAHKQKIIMGFMITAALLLVLLLFYMYRGYRQKKRANDLLLTKNKIIYKKNSEITASIRYAKRIQEAILTSSQRNSHILPEHFIFFKPKDIVSGDFYWIHVLHGTKAIWAVVDCTGHGVPGAFMSMIGNRLLNEIIKEQGISSANIILNTLKEKIIAVMNQEGRKGESSDGMDMSLCIWDQTNNQLEYAGANNPLYLVRKDIAKENSNNTANSRYFQEDLLELRANRQPIGYHPYKNEAFTMHRIQLKAGDSIYLFSDGYADQFGGENSKKFTSKRFKRLLISMRGKNMEEQKHIIENTFHQWKGEKEEQIDDICIIGVKV